MGGGEESTGTGGESFEDPGGGGTGCGGGEDGRAGREGVGGGADWEGQESCGGVDQTGAVMVVFGRWEK